jgi:hypothetical protein
MPSNNKEDSILPVDFGRRVFTAHAGGHTRTESGLGQLWIVG